MKILMYGINQDTISKEESIIHDFKKADKEKLLQELIEFDGVKELAIYYSSYRIEFYFHVDETVFQHGDLLRFFSNYTDKSLNEVILQMYSLFNEDVARHVLELSTGYHAKERGTLKNLQVLENNLLFLSCADHMDSVLKLLFARAIIFAYQTKMMRQLGPLLLDTRLQPIKRITLNQEDWIKSKIIVLGDDLYASLLGKIFATNQVKTLTWAISDSCTESEEVLSMTRFISCPYAQTPTKIHLTNYRDMDYWLADADIIIDLRKDQSAAGEVLEKQVKAIRQTPKKQLYISSLENKDSSLNSKLFQEPKEFARKDYSDEEINQAEVVFDELVRHQVHQFMEEYTQILTHK